MSQQRGAAGTEEGEDDDDSDSDDSDSDDSDAEEPPSHVHAAIGHTMGTFSFFYVDTCVSFCTRVLCYSMFVKEIHKIDKHIIFFFINPAFTQGRIVFIWAACG